MIAKILVQAKDRESALLKMRGALDETVIFGIETNLDFLYQILRSNVFTEGKADTGFVELFVKGGSHYV